jgi:hypothetical protein
MTSKVETIEITQALLAISAALRETRQALLLLKPQDGDDFLKHLENSADASDECLEHILKLIKLIETSGE